MRAMFPASLLLPVFLACFGQLANTDILPAGSCPLTDPLDYTVLLPNPSDCSSFFSCSNGVPIEKHCPDGLHFNDNLKTCDWPVNANCVRRTCPLTDPLYYTVLLPNPSDCTSFFSCSNGVPIEMHCPDGLHFNDNWKVCDWPENANCVKRCTPLQNDEAGTWSPSSCTEDFCNLGDTCKLQCNKDYQLRGSSVVQCTDQGWNSSNGNFIPRCQPEECIGGDLDNDLNKTLSGKAGILFVLDESGSVGVTNFGRTKTFVRDVVQKYPLSADRSAGIITFDSGARTQVHLNLDSTSTFLNAVDKLGYSAGGTSILAALQMAVTEINSYSVHDLTVVVLITDGQSSTDGTPAADIIKNAGNPLFAIGIDSNNNLLHLEALSSMGDNGIKHFFHVTSYEALENIGHYLNPSARSNGSRDSSKCSDE